MGKEVFIMGYMENYKKWCEDTYFDEATRAELKAIEGNDKEIQERFYKDLEFGTGEDELKLTAIETAKDELMDVNR